MSDNRTPCMLYSLPTELLLGILRFLPQSDRCVTCRVSKLLHAATLPLLDTAKCSDVDELKTLLSAMLDDPASLRIGQLRCLELEADLSAQGEGDVEGERLVRLLQRAENINELHILDIQHSFHNVTPRIIDAIVSLPFLRTLVLAYIPPNAKLGAPHLLSRLSADGLQTLHLYFAPGITDPEFRTMMFSSISRLTRLHTLTIGYIAHLIDEQRFPPRPLSVSVRDLTIASSRIKSLSNVFALFPSIDVLSFDCVSTLRLEEPSVRLAHLKTCAVTLALMEFSSWPGLKLGWLELPLHILDTQEGWYIRYVRNVASYMADGYPLGLSVQIRQPSREWTTLAECLPNLRWMEVQLSRDALADDVAEALVEPGRQWPFHLIYLNVIFPATITLLGTLRAAVGGAHAGSSAEQDDTARQVLVEKLPRCIPTLRYLTISRRFSLNEGSESQRAWACYRVTEDRGMVQIPEWEGERVRAYCQDAMDPEAFDKFDERFVPLR